MEVAEFSVDLNDLVQFPKAGIFSKVLAKSENYSHTMMCLARGTDIDTHTSTKNGCVYVIKGRGTFTLAGRDIVLQPGVYIYMPANSPHSLQAEDDLAILLCLSK